MASTELEPAAATAAQPAAATAAQPDAATAAPPPPSPYQPAPTYYPPPNMGYSMPPQPNRGYSMPPQPNMGYSMPPQPNMGYSMPPQPKMGYAMPPPLTPTGQQQQTNWSRTFMVMGTRTASAARTVLIPEKRGVNHTLHCIITFFFFPWIIVWILLCICHGCDLPDVTLPEIE